MACEVPWEALGIPHGTPWEASGRDWIVMPHGTPWDALGG